jgi:hypothetical protein
MELIAGVRRVLQAVVCCVAVIITSSAVSAQQHSFTDSFIPEERAQSGLSKLTTEELTALDKAFVRVFVDLVSKIQEAPTRGTTAPVPSQQDEFSLYNSSGAATAFIEPSDDLTIYLWSGEPVTYIVEESVCGVQRQASGLVSERRDPRP